jgi:chemosensory pili system protein ChpA (sensor histidine kinase/response regulator)
VTRSDYNPLGRDHPATEPKMISWISSLWARLRQALGGRSDESIDPEVREIFLSELDEVGESLSGLLPAWRAQRRHAATLQEIRRGFHTLKGSGLAVGASELAGFCGRIEKLTLDLIERPGSAAPGAVADIERAIGLLPACARALRAGSPMPAALHGVAGSVRDE